METLIDRVTALFQGEQTNVGVLDGQQLQNSLTHREVFIAEEFAAQSLTPNGGVCRILHHSFSKATYRPSRHRHTAIARLRTSPHPGRKMQPRFQSLAADRAGPAKSGPPLRRARWGPDVSEPNRPSASRSSPGECN